MANEPTNEASNPLSPATSCGPYPATVCSAYDRLVICDHANNCPRNDGVAKDYCSGLKPHLRGYAGEKLCVSGHICCGIKVRCVEVPMPNPSFQGTPHKLAAMR